MTEFVLTFLGACLVNNLVLHYLLGVGPAVDMSRRLRVATDFGLLSAAAFTLAAPIGHLLYFRLLLPLGLDHLALLIFIFILMALAYLAAALLKGYRPALHGRVEVLMPLLLGNCALVGVALLEAGQAHDFISSLAFGLGTGAGFLLVLVLLATLQDRLFDLDAPAPFRGLPLLLLSLGILSMGFMGFTGLTNR